jgi:hypothetical protein
MGGLGAGATTGGGLAGSTGGSTTALLDAHPSNTMHKTAIHPKTIADRILLTVFMRPRLRVVVERRKPFTEKAQ